MKIGNEQEKVRISKKEKEQDKDEVEGCRKGVGGG